MRYNDLADVKSRRVMNGEGHGRYRAPPGCDEKINAIPLSKTSAEGCDALKTKRSKYTTDTPRKLYSFFHGYDGPGAPSFSKFARSIGITVAELESYRKRSEFERAYQECSEIRRDYLIDNGLVKRFDSSFTKFLLNAEYDMGDAKGHDADNEIRLTLEVLGDAD